MASVEVFVDTWAFLAMTNRRDQWHSRAVKLNRQLSAKRRPLVTTDWVLAEFLAGAAEPPARLLAVQGVKKLQESPRTIIVPATHDSWAEGFELYEQHSDKGWSLTDCVSILVCRQRGISDVFSRDHHFEQAGLTLLLPHDN